jgi:lipopolysaccharide biosynthesis regulator YciM
MVELFWLLLPVAALSGWYAGRRSQTGGQTTISRSYFKGLNYLLSEQPDKAIEVFTKMLEVDSETAEIHLALGNLFRRRGEVDRAIRIHQNLIARPSLTREQRALALLELGHDYMKAGLLDRAESLFLQVVEAGAGREAALAQLLVIYQQEREWQKAVAVALKLEAAGDRTVRTAVAQFLCEQAEGARAAHEVAEARALLKKALTHDPSCVRASLLQGDLERELGNWRAALKAYLRVKQQDADYLLEAVKPMQQCYEALGDPSGWVRVLREAIEERPSTGLALVLADHLGRTQGAPAARDFLTEHVKKVPSIPGLSKLLALSREQFGSEQRRDLEFLVPLSEELLESQPLYECRQCGFSARSLYWQCPSCRCWTTVKPIVHGLEVQAQNTKPLKLSAR